MNAIDEIAVNMPISRACSLIGIPRRTYYARKPLHMRSAGSRILLILCIGSKSSAMNVLHMVTGEYGHYSVMKGSI